MSLKNTNGDTVGEDVVGDADEIADSLALNGLVVDKDVGVAGLFAFVVNNVGLLKGAAVVGKLLGLAEGVVVIGNLLGLSVGLNKVGNVVVGVAVAVSLLLIGLIVDVLADISGITNSNICHPTTAIIWFYGAVQHNDNLKSIDITIIAYFELLCWEKGCKKPTLTSRHTIISSLKDC